MPSPFPGMDPYLENPAIWPGVHHRLISEIQESLNASIRPKYFARVEERVYLTDDDDPGRLVLIPDVRVSLSPRNERDVYSPDAGGVGIVEPEEIVDTTLEIREARLEVIDHADRKVVTVIEILSPSNKIRGSRGYESYQQKRRDVLESPSHFVEVDLLRKPSTYRFGRLYPQHPYAVMVSRAERRPKWQLWKIRLSDCLPAVGIPLRGDDPDAPLDLQHVLSTAYDRGAYDADIDYTRPADPPLAEEDATWATQVMAANRQASS